MNSDTVRRQLKIYQPFDLDAVLVGTQDFRWRRRDDGWHSGVLAGDLIHVRQVGGGIEYRASSDLDGLLTGYLRLDEDIEDIRSDLAARDETIARLLKKHPYLRVLRQPDRWECTVSYICSAANRINRMCAIVEGIAETFGSSVELEGEVRYTFPSQDLLLDTGLARLAQLGLGMDRHAKIIAAAERIRDGRLDLEYLSQPHVCYAEAKRRLMVCYGIGEKIADCIALFALDKTEAFPVDTWVEKAMAYYFPASRQLAGEELVMWAQDRFGKYAGFANQLLFHELWHSRNRRSARKWEPIQS